MSDVVPLIAVIALWIPIAAGIAWLFQRGGYGYRR